MSNLKILGHKPQREKLKRLLNSSRLPSVLLFSGPSGVGKFLVAKEFARSLICDSFKTRSEKQPAQYAGCGKCHACHLFDSGNYPDAVILDADGSDQTGVEAVRSVIHSMQFKAFSGSVRVVILKDLEHLSLTALNVLLKSLEEPRNDTYYILTSANHYKLPATLLSRCQLWYFDQLSEADIRAFIKANHPNADAATLAVLADGSLESLDSLTSDIQSLRELEEMIEALVNGRYEVGFKLVHEISRDKLSLRTKLAVLRIIVRQRMHLATDSSQQGRAALLLYNLIEAERLIFERNLSPANVLNLLLLDFGRGPDLEFESALGRGASLAEKLVL